MKNTIKKNIIVNLFNIFLIIALLAILYGFYNILYSRENNKEDFLIYENSNKRGYEYVDMEDLSQIQIEMDEFDEQQRIREEEAIEIEKQQEIRYEELVKMYDVN